MIDNKKIEEFEKMIEENNFTLAEWDILQKNVTNRFVSIAKQVVFVREKEEKKSKKTSNESKNESK